MNCTKGGIEEGRRPDGDGGVESYGIIEEIEEIESGVQGSRSAFEFPSRVNLSCPSLYGIARTLGKKADPQ